MTAGPSVFAAYHLGVSNLVDRLCLWNEWGKDVVEGEKFAVRSHVVRFRFGRAN